MSNLAPAASRCAVRAAKPAPAAKPPAFEPAEAQPSMSRRRSTRGGGAEGRGGGAAGPSGDPEALYGPASKFMEGTVRGRYRVTSDARGRACWKEM